jgi:enoyl-CoA hydratase/carnithine racemase
LEIDTEKKEFETIIYEKSGNVASITFNRPEKHNCLSYQMLDDLEASLDYAEEDESTNVLILKAKGKSFCSGLDTKGSYYTTPPEEESKLRFAAPIYGELMRSRNTSLTGLL